MGSWLSSRDGAQQTITPHFVRMDGLFNANPQYDDVFDAIRQDYQALGFFGRDLVAPGPLNSLAVDKTERLDPSPTADERAFWGSPLGIDGWQPDFTKHPYPHWRLPVDDTELGDDEVDGSAFTRFFGRVWDTDWHTYRFDASNLTPTEADRFRHRLDNLCPVKELKTIAENCLDSPQGRANRGHCWLENSLFIQCNELKKRFMTTRQRMIYIYGSIKDDYREADEEDEEDDPNEFEDEHLYIYRWEFYRLQYKEAKREIFKRQMKAHQAPANQSFWRRLISPSVWLKPSSPAPSAPRHIQNYLYEGNHWLSAEEVLHGTWLPREVRERSVHNYSEDFVSEETMREIISR